MGGGGLPHLVSVSFCAAEETFTSQRHSVFMATVDVTLLFTVFSTDAITVIVPASLIIFEDRATVIWCEQCYLD